jgi:hypothetical protein
MDEVRTACGAAEKPAVQPEFEAKYLRAIVENLNSYA